MSEFGSDLEKKVIRSRAEEFVTVSGLALPNYLVALDQHLPERTTVHAFTLARRFDVIWGSSVRKPQLILTDGVIEAISPETKLSFSHDPSYLAWLTQESDDENHWLRTALSAPQLREIQAQSNATNIQFWCKPLRSPWW